MSEDLRPLREQDPTPEDRAYDEGRGVATLEYRNRIAELDERLSHTKCGQIFAELQAEVESLRQTNANQLDALDTVKAQVEALQRDVSQWQNAANTSAESFDRVTDEIEALRQKVSDAEWLRDSGFGTSLEEYRCGEYRWEVWRGDLTVVAWSSEYWYVLHAAREASDG